MAMKNLKYLLCGVLTLAQIAQQAHGLISPSAGGGGGGGFFKGFQKRLKADSIRSSSMPIDQLREALINSQAFRDLVARLEDRTHHDTAVVDAAQVKLVDPSRNASNDPPVPAATSGNGGGPNRARSIPSVAADTTAISTPAPLGSSAEASDLPTQRENTADATTGSPRAAAGAGSEASTKASPAAASKPPPFSLFGRGRDGKKNLSPKPAAGKDVGEKGKAEVEAATRAEEQLQVGDRWRSNNTFAYYCPSSRVSMTAQLIPFIPPPRVGRVCRKRLQCVCAALLSRAPPPEFKIWCMLVLLAQAVFLWLLHGGVSCVMLNLVHV